MAEQIRVLEAKLATFPEGNLICTRNGNRFKWYQSINHSPVYLPKKERKLAEQLAAKKYISFLLEDLRSEQKALESYLRKHDLDVGQSARQLLDMPGYRELLTLPVPSQNQELLDWVNVPYEHNSKYPEQLTHRTLSGHKVRSKSEAMIDMALSMNHIPFRYECALYLGDTTVYPDFTIKHPKSEKIYYWEHFGLMDEPAYSKNVFSKLQLYASHHIIPTIQLITTYETKEHPLSSETVDHIVKEYFC